MAFGRLRGRRQITDQVNYVVMPMMYLVALEAWCIDPHLLAQHLDWTNPRFSNWDEIRRTLSGKKNSDKFVEALEWDIYNFGERHNFPGWQNLKPGELDESSSADSLLTFSTPRIETFTRRTKK